LHANLCVSCHNPRTLEKFGFFAAVWFAAFSAVTFLAFGFDKWKASRSGWRVSEFALVMFGALGG